jgi:acyl carrier protein
MKREDLVLQIKQMVIHTANLADKRPEEIDEKMSLFGGGLGLDSVDLLELVINLDKTFGLKVRNDEAGKAVLTSVGTIADAVMGTSS